MLRLSSNIIVMACSRISILYRIRGDIRAPSIDAIGTQRCIVVLAWSRIVILPWGCVVPLPWTRISSLPLPVL